MIKTITIITLTTLWLFATGCQSVKEGLTGKKTNNSDEFLIKKKNPLILPPEFEKLPKPKDALKEEKQEEFDISKIIKSNQGEVINDVIKKNDSLEKSILKKINKN